MAHYIIFGDSITYGQNDLKGGWVQYLREELTNDIVYNLGIDGETTTGLVNRLEEEIKPRLSEDDPNIVVIALGVNDSARISLKEFQQNLIQLIKLAQIYTSKIIFIGPAPIDQIKVDPVPWAPEISYKTNLVKQYSETMQMLASQEKLKFVDLFHSLPPEYIKTLDDGLHPNHAGHQMIFDLVKTQL